MIRDYEYFDAQTLMWTPLPTAITYSNIRPCCDLDLDASTFKTRRVHLWPQVYH